MLRNKSTKIFSETNSFFTSTEKGIFKIMELYRSLHLKRLQIGDKEKPQSTFRKGDLLLGLLLFPLNSISNVYSYTKHPLSNMLEAGKNTFYRLKNDSNINWRSIVSRSNKLLFEQIPDTAKEGDCPKCLIMDDTDFEKSTYKTEHVGKIWSHVRHSRFFGFKGLFLGYWGQQEFLFVKL